MKNTMVDLFACTCRYHDGKLYCFARNINLLFSVDLQDGKIEPLDAVPEEDILTNYLFGAINIWNSKLILAPNNAKKVWIYDIISKHWESLSINEYDHWGSGGIHQIYICNNLIYMIGSSYPAIICLDLEKNSCEYIEQPYMDVKERHQDIDFLYFRIHGVQLKNFLYLASCLDNFVLKFDMTTKEYEWIKVGSDEYVYSEIAWDGSNFWLSPRLNCDIVKWDGNKKTKNLTMPFELKPTTNTYIWTACYDGNHVIFPCLSHPKSIIIDTHKDSFQIQEQQYTHLYTRLDNGMVVSQTIEGDLSIKTGDSPPKTYKMIIDIDKLKQFYEKKGRKILTDQTLYNEEHKGHVLSLENYLNFIEPKTYDQSAANGPIGKAIWESIR